MYLELKKGRLAHARARKSMMKNASGRVEPYLLEGTDTELSVGEAFLRKVPQMSFQDITAQVSGGGLLIVSNTKVYDAGQFIGKHPVGRRRFHWYGCKHGYSTAS